MEHVARPIFSSQTSPITTPPVVRKVVSPGKPNTIKREASSSSVRRELFSDSTLTRENPLFISGCNLLGLDSETITTEDTKIVTEILELVSEKLDTEDGDKILVWVQKALFEVPGEKKYRPLYAMLHLEKRVPQKDSPWPKDKPVEKEVNDEVSE